MMTMAKIAIILAIILMLQSYNPLKMSILVLLLSATMFSHMSSMTGSTWMPSIFFLLFMGGILIMFMIISSLMPNSKPKKMKNMIITILAMVTMSMYELSKTMDSTNFNMKWILSSKLILLFLTMLMTLYFMIFIETLNMSKNSMRSYLCQ